MSQIKFDVGQATQTAGKLKSQAGSIERNINDLGKKIGVLKTYWEGESAGAYLKQYEELQPDLKKLVSCINEIGEQITKIAKIKTETELQIKNQIASGGRR